MQAVTFHRSIRRGIVALFLALAFPFAASANAAPAATDEAEPQSEAAQAQAEILREKWGIELVAMRSTAANHMVDFRYRVLDAEKAAPLFDRQTKPYLIHHKSGKALAVPSTAKVGALRNSNMPREGRVYWMFFGNHHHLVQRGDKVTVAIGDFKATDLTVE